MLSGKSFINEEWKKNQPYKTNECGIHRIKLGLNLRLDHLILLVDCTQRATGVDPLMGGPSYLLCNSLLCGTLTKVLQICKDRIKNTIMI